MPTVLVVDDTASIRFLIRTNLELAGYTVIEAEDGQYCLDRLDGADDLPDLITMDIMMPRMDGITAASRIRSNDRFDAIPIVMVTTQGLQSDMNRATAAGVDAYLTKPFEPDELVATVERVLGSHR